MEKHFSKILINLIIALILEVIVFNITSYRILFGKYQKYECEDPIVVMNEGSKVRLHCDNLNFPVGTIKIDLKDEEVVATDYKVFFSDKTSSIYRGLNLKKYIPNNEKSKYLPVYLSGEVNGIMIEFDSAVYNDGNFNKIIINEKIPFEFNLIRFLVTLGILEFIYVFKNTEVFKELYSSKSLKQENILLLVIGVFFILTAFINQNSLEDDTEKIYNEQFVKAVYNGEFYLEREPSESFKELENPYDDLQRSSLIRGEDYIWDTAYYNGRFYIYFGILPLLVAFLPYYAITNKILDMALVCFILSLAIFILIKELLLKIINRYFEKVEFKNVFFSLIMLCSGSLILYANRNV